MATILIVEDEPGMAKVLKKGLEKSGYKVILIDNGLDARMYDLKNIDLVILDWGLPMFDGISVLSYWRNQKKYTTPVLMFTARSQTSDKVTGLDYGADDYMSKFFEWDELKARVRALLRRGVKEVKKIGGIEWDKDNQSFLEDGKLVNLTKTEYNITAYFFEHKNNIIDAYQIISAVYDFDSMPDSNVISRHIKSIRKKFKNDFIETIRGMGYRLKLK